MKKKVLYDGDCSLCRRAIRALERRGLLRDVLAIPWQEAGETDPELAERIRSEILMLDAGRVYGGFYAIARLIERRYPVLSKFFSMPGVLQAGQVCYRFISLNRRILAPTGKIPCACDPPFHAGYRIAFWVVFLLLALALSAVLGFLSQWLVRLAF